MNSAIIAALDYSGNHKKARRLLQAEGNIPHMLGKSRFNRRWHRNADLVLTLKPDRRNPETVVQTFDLCD